MGHGTCAGDGLLLEQIRSIWVLTNGASLVCAFGGALAASHMISAVAVPLLVYASLAAWRRGEEVLLGMDEERVADRRAGFLSPGALSASAGWLAVAAPRALVVFALK